MIAKGPGSWKWLKAVALKEVEQTLAGLPAPLKERALALPITFEPVPNEGLVGDGIAPDTLGLFTGMEFSEETSSAVPLPPQIILFLENLWLMAEDDEALYREEVRTTLLHELGHYLGLTEEDLYDRGLE
jgi:predicted Zn-dependent protease with MMP-like domain